MILRPERDVSVGLLHSSPWLDALSQADLSFQLLSLCFQGDGHATPKDHVDLIILIVFVGIILSIFSLSWFLCCGLIWHLFKI
jgi:hypothetical protein